MTAISQLDSDFALLGAGAYAEAAELKAEDPPGPLLEMPGPAGALRVRVGRGFNVIWRPHRRSTGADRSVELQLTDEKLVFDSPC